MPIYAYSPRHTNTIIGTFLKYIMAPYKKNGKRRQLNTVCGVKAQKNKGWNKALNMEFDIMLTTVDKESCVV